MTYKVNYTDLTKTPIIVQDGTVDTTTNVGLVGRGYTGFGEVVAENFLHLLENFADETPPARPTPGQIWYDNNNSILYYYTVSDVWKKVGDVKTAASTPTTNDGEVTGDFWLDTTTNNLYMFNDPNWVLMTSGDVTTKVYTRIRKDNITPVAGTHKTLEMVVNGNIVAILTSDVVTWTPCSSGINTEYMDDGVTLLANIYPTLRLGLNLVDRKTITEVTVTNTNPTLVNPYLRTGDLWVNSSSGRLFSFNGLAWDRLNGFVKVRNAVPVVEGDEQTGDLWVNTLTGDIYYYNNLTTSWNLLSGGTTFSAVDPSITDIKNIGDFWINTTTRILYIYDGAVWVQLTYQELGTFIITKTRLDTNDISHKVLETIVNGKTASVIASDLGSWVPKSDELLYEGGFYASYFPDIMYGINLPHNVGELTTVYTSGTDPGGVEYDVWINNGGTYPTYIKVRNGASAWIQPTHIYEQTTTPSTPTPVQYDYWINPTTLITSIYNGSSWVAKTPTYNGSLQVTSYGVAPVFNGIGRFKGIPDSYSSYFNYDSPISVTTQWSDIAVADVYVYPAAFIPYVKGTMIVHATMDSVTSYGARIVRRAIDTSGNVILGSSEMIHGITMNLASSANDSKHITLSFMDLIGTRLSAFYTLGTQKTYRTRYALQLIKTGTTFTTTGITVDLEQVYFA